MKTYSLLHMTSVKYPDNFDKTKLSKSIIHEHSLQQSTTVDLSSSSETSGNPNKTPSSKFRDQSSGSQNDTNVHLNAVSKKSSKGPFLQVLPKYVSNKDD